MIGTNIAHYKITAKLGQGGMGEVYRATDTKLDREVAIKVLPESFAQDKERLARFDREAKALAALSHPNIAGIFGVEQEGDVHALVMELVEGEDLSQRLMRGPLPVEEALDVCNQIAEALETAHEKGIIHRDLKPANVKLSEDGKVKVLDFGLAKSTTPESSNPSTTDSLSPTITADYTMPGTLLGTAAYMSPEQARGKSVDKRSDIFSFGCVLFECLTGKRLFKGEDTTDTLAAIIKGEPDWTALPPETPPTIHLLLRKCLAKDRKRRLHDIADARVDLEQAISDPSSSFIRLSDEALQEAGGGSGIQRPVVAGLVLGVALVAIALTWFLRPAPVVPSPTRHLNLKLPEEAPLAPVGSASLGVGRPALAVSPDGRLLVYVAQKQGTTELRIRPLDQFETKGLPGTDGSYGPFFSPDGKWVGFIANDRLKKVRVTGGEPTTICEVADSFGAVWGKDDRIIFTDNGRSILSVSSGGGPVKQHAAGVMDWPSPLPGGHSVLVNDRSGVIMALDLDTGLATSVLGVKGSEPVYLQNGYLMYMDHQSSRLTAAAFDLDSLKIVGQPEPLLYDIRTESDRHAGQFTLSTNGMFIYLPGVYMGVSQLAWVNRDGSHELLEFPAEVYGTFRLSPDGNFLAIQVYGTKSDIWIYDFVKQRKVKFTWEGNNFNPVWTPNGERIVFTSDRTGERKLFWKQVDGASRPELLLEDQGERLFSPSSWTPDGKTLALYGRSPGTLGDLYTLSMEGSKIPTLLASTPSFDWGPQFSPDGRWLAYTGNESGNDQIYVVPFPSTGERWQISTRGGEEPVWSPDGKELHFRNKQQWMTASIEVEPSFNAGNPHVRFEGPYLNVGGQSYDVSSDRFLVLVGPDQENAHTELNVIVNWMEFIESKLSTTSTSGPR
jgi:Tol biopolymer transport system component